MNRILDYLHVSRIISISRLYSGRIIKISKLMLEEQQYQLTAAEGS
jgi:hypothetical protein